MGQVQQKKTRAEGGAPASLPELRAAVGFAGSTRGVHVRVWPSCAKAFGLIVLGYDHANESQADDSWATFSYRAAVWVAAAAKTAYI